MYDPLTLTFYAQYILFFYISCELLSPIVYLGSNIQRLQDKVIQMNTPSKY